MNFKGEVVPSDEVTYYPSSSLHTALGTRVLRLHIQSLKAIHPQLAPIS